MKTRIYKYALKTTPQQLGCLERIGATSRYLWNRLVAQTKYVQHEIANGRRGTIEKSYIDLLSAKALVGMRAKAVSDLATERGLSKEEALPIFIREKAAEDIQIVVRKNGTKAKRWSTNHLAWKYAVEKVNSQREILLSSSARNVWTGIQAKWIDFGSSWDKGIFGAPRYKKCGTISAIQKQIWKTNKWEFGNTVDLSWCGSPLLEYVEINQHREIPSGAIIKQIALVKETNEMWYICVFLQAEDSVFSRHFKPCDGKIVGIDPGLKSAMITSDGRHIEPNSISKQDHQERKLKKLQRKLARQTRLGNPQCFADDGTWKRGQRITYRSKGMLQTAKEIARIKKYFRDAKSDYYHHAAIDLLNNYDTIAIGNAKLHTLVRGGGRAKKAQNLKVREHSIGEFKTKLKDKTSLSLTPKTFCEIVEAYTTKTCNKCGYVNNTLTLDDRQWDCPQCKTHHDRDTNAAINIRISAAKQLATGSQSVSGEKSPKVRKSKKTNAPIEGRVAETTSP